MQGMGWACLEELVWGDAQHAWVRPGHLFTRGPGTYKVRRGWAGEAGAEYGRAGGGVGPGEAGMGAGGQQGPAKAASKPWSGRRRSTALHRACSPSRCTPAHQPHRSPAPTTSPSTSASRCCATRPATARPPCTRARRWASRPFSWVRVRRGRRCLDGCRGLLSGRAGAGRGRCKPGCAGPPARALAHASFSPLPTPLSRHLRLLRPQRRLLRRPR